MKGKHLLVALVIAGMACGVVGYIYFGSVQKEKSYISFEEAIECSRNPTKPPRWMHYVKELRRVGQYRDYAFKVYKEGNITGYFLYRASNGTLFEADYSSGKTGKPLCTIIAPEDKEEYYVWDIIASNTETGKETFIDARNGEILLVIPAGKRAPIPPPTTPTEEETPPPPPTKLLPAYTLDITFPSTSVTVRKGESVTLPVAIRSWVDDEPKNPSRLKIFPDPEFPLPEFIMYEVEGYITVNPQETVSTQITIKVSEDAQLGEYSFYLYGELEKPLEEYSCIAYHFSLIVVS